MAERETKVTVTAEVDGYIAGMERATEATLGLAAAARELLAAGINPADITPTVLRSVELLASAGRSGGADVPPLDALRALEEESAQETAARVSAVGVNVYSIKRPAYRRVVTAEKFDQPGPVVADQGQWLAAARELGAAGIRGDDLVNSLHEILERGHPRDYETWRAFLTTRTDDQLVEEYGRDLVRAAVVLARAKQ
jgi:hypothetical protein